MISLEKCQEVVAYTIGASLNGNCYSFAIKLLNVLLFIKYMTEDSFFCE